MNKINSALTSIKNTSQAASALSVLSQEQTFGAEVSIAFAILASGGYGGKTPRGRSANEAQT